MTATDVMRMTVRNLTDLKEDGTIEQCKPSRFHEGSRKLPKPHKTSNGYMSSSVIMPGLKTFN